MTRVLRCLLITKLRSDICVEEVNNVQGFVRFTVEVRVKNLEGSVHQNMRKQVLKIRSLSPRAASVLGLIVTLPNMLPTLYQHRDGNEHFCVFGHFLEVSAMNDTIIIFSHVSSYSSGNTKHHRTWRFYVFVRGGA